MNEELRKQALGARILIVDDAEDNVRLLERLLRKQGFIRVSSASDGRLVAGMHRDEPFDLILLDLEMPGFDGMAVMQELRRLGSSDFLPVIVVSGHDDAERRLSALREGARDYVLKPFVASEVMQRIDNFLEVQLLYRELAREAKALEQRVKTQVEQLERLSRLKRFFSPHLAEVIVAGTVDDPLRPHRREITAAFIDLRNFTAFTERATPEEVMELLHDYHAEMGNLILDYEGTLEYFAGDGIMVIFNDPVPMPDAPQRAVRMALDMHRAFVAIRTSWEKRGFEVGLGVGVAQGHATIGAIGFQGRLDYAAIGSVCNLSARLCGEAPQGKVLVDESVKSRLGDRFAIEPVQPMRLKGFLQPVPAYLVERR